MTARLLFVDDEPRILEGIENMLFERDDWELELATSGEEALRILARSTFDAVITDMRMPVMDGLQLLRCVLRDYPHMIRIVLSGDAEKEAAMQAITIAHQYIAKPCEAPQLIALIERALHIASVVPDDQLRRSLGMISELPHDHSHLREIYRLASSPNASVPVVARAIQNDIGMSTKLVQAASSAIFGGNPVTSVAAAVQRVGLDGVRALALSLEVYARLPLADPGLVAERQAYCLAVASLASSIATVDADRAYLCGLLHDLGTLTLAMHMPQRMTRVREAWTAGEGSLIDLERREFGIDHATLGAEILEQFGMHDTAVVVRNAWVPSRSGLPARLDALGALHIAAMTMHSMADGREELDPEYLAALGPAATVTVMRARNLARAA